MAMSGSRTGELGVLAAALQDPDADISTMLGVFVDDVNAAIPSYLGLQVTLQLDGAPFTLGTMEAATAGAARTSLRLAVDPVYGAEPTSAIILYAAHPGAFVDLTADAERLWGRDGRVNLDQHLPARADRPGSAADDLRRRRDINRPIAVLMTQGHTPGRARERLHQIAAEQHVTESVAAASIVQASTPADKHPTEHRR